MPANVTSRDLIPKQIPQPHLSLGDACTGERSCKGTIQTQIQGLQNHQASRKCQSWGFRQSWANYLWGHISDVKQVTPLKCTVQHIPNCTGMGHHCTITVNPDRVTDLQWQAMDRTLPDNLAEIAGKAGEISEIISTWLLELCGWWQHWINSH